MGASDWRRLCREDEGGGGLIEAGDVRHISAGVSAASGPRTCASLQASDRWGLGDGVEAILQVLENRREPEDNKRAAAQQMRALTNPKDIMRAQPGARFVIKLLKAETSDESKEAAALALCTLLKVRHQVGNSELTSPSKRRRKAVRRLVDALSMGSAASQAAAATALRDIANCSDEARLCVHKSKATHGLTSLLTRAPSGATAEADGEPAALEVAAIKAIRELAINPEVCIDFVGTPVTSALCNHLASGKVEVATAAAWALCTLACLPALQDALLSPYEGCMPELLSLAQRGADAQEAAAWVIHNAGSSRDNTPRLVEAGVLPALVEGLQDGSDLCKEAAARAISNTASFSSDTATATVRAGAVPPLLALLRSGVHEGAPGEEEPLAASSYSRRGAAMALCQLALWVDNRQLLVDQGGGELVGILVAELEPPRNPTCCERGAVKLQEAASLALQNLLAGPGFHVAVLNQSRAVPALVGLLDGANGAVFAAAGASLVNLLTEVPPSLPEKERMTINVDDCEDTFHSVSQDNEIPSTTHPGGPHDAISTSHGSAVVEAVEAMASHSVPERLASMLSSPDGNPNRLRHHLCMARKLQAAQVLSCLAQCSPEGLAAFHEAGAMPAFIRQLGKWDSDTGLPTSLAYVAAALLADMPQGSVDVNGASEPLARMLSVEDAAILSTVVSALTSVASQSGTERSKLAANSRAIRRLALLASPPTPSSPYRRRLSSMNTGSVALRASAASGLRIVASDGDSARRAVSRHALRPLVALLEAGEPPAVEQAARALGELARLTDLRKSLTASGATWMLNAVLRNGSPKESEAAAAALQLLEPWNWSGNPRGSSAPPQVDVGKAGSGLQHELGVAVECRSSTSGAPSPRHGNTPGIAHTRSDFSPPFPSHRSNGSGVLSSLTNFRRSLSESLSQRASLGGWTGITARKSTAHYDVLS